MIIKVAKFDATGRYVFSGYMDTDGPSAGPEMIYVGDVDIDTHYHDLTTHAPVPMPAKPSEMHVFDYASKVWIDPRTLQDHRDAKWLQIKADRAAAVAAPLVTPFGIFDADAAGELSITKGVLLANNMAALGQAVSIDFTLADNSVVPLSAAEMVAVGLALGAREQAVRAVATALRAQISAAASLAQLDAIVWPSPFVSSF